MARRCKVCSKELPTAAKCKAAGDVLGVKMLCSPGCAAEFASTNLVPKIQKEREQKAKREKTKAKKVAKEKLKSIADWEREAQTEINRYVRARDHGKPCVSCDKPYDEVMAEQGWKTGGAWDCGHWRTRAAAPQLRFNLYNMHSQCKSCNAGSGKYGRKAESVGQGYDRIITERLGAERVEWLRNYNEPSKKELMCRVDYIEYLKRIKKIFAKRYRQCARRKGLI